MIIVKLQGGMGNQLFQYALGRHLSILRKTQLKLDLDFFDKANDGVTKISDIRKFELAELTIIRDRASRAEIARFARYRRRGRAIFWLYNVLCADPRKYVRETNYAFDPSILELGDDVYLDGIWLSEKYFAAIAPTIRQDFTLTTPLEHSFPELTAALSKPNSVALHIRRGDLATSAKASSSPLSLEYYSRAAKYMADHVPNPHFFVFSDEIDWAKANLKLPYPCTFVSDYSRISNCQELIMMSRCAHIIMANSTFSWWSAWLNTNPNKIVITPTILFKDPERTKNTRDFIPAEWIRM